jgi:hypothetical protein
VKAKVISKNKVVYRSNLEAIYGGLFEEAGIDFVFEPKLFETPYGYYLPDFYLTRYDLYVEIKPNEPSEEEWNKLKSVSNQVGRPALLLYGRPRLDVFHSTYTDQRMNYIVGVFLGLVFPNVDFNYHANTNEIIDRLGVEVENFFQYAFATRLQGVLDNLHTHHIEDYLMAKLTEMAPEQRYKFHKENPPIRTFEHCLLDDEYCLPGIAILENALFELEKLANRRSKEI